MSEEKKTKCWSCRRPGTGTCSWDARLEPVAGWTAIESLWRANDVTKAVSVSYSVTACPLYVPGPKRVEPRPTPPGRKKSFDVDRLVQLVHGGARTEFIARELGLSPGTVQNYRRKVLRGELL